MSDMTSLEAVKRYLGIAEDQTEDDELLSALIAGVLAGIQHWIGRDLGIKTYRDTVDGNDKNRIMFSAWPVRAVSEVIVSGRPIPPASGFYDYGYRFDETMLILNSGIFHKGCRNVEIEYEAGYEEIPADIAGICTKLVAARFKERDWLGHSSKSLGGETVSFTEVDTSPSVRAVLASYRKVMP